MSILSPQQSTFVNQSTAPAPWYEQCYRKLFFDFHNLACVGGLAQKFDSQAWADQLQLAHVQAVSVFVSCGQGYRYYLRGHVGHIHPRLAEGLDMVQEQIDSLHARDIRAIGYYYTFGNPHVAQAHPDWVEHDVDHKPRVCSSLAGPPFCIISPFVEQYLLPQLAEIASNYDLDGLFFDGTFAKNPPCHCPSCRQRFARASGGLTIPKDQHDEQWQAYANWKLSEFTKLRDQIVQTINAHKPQMLVTFNWAFSTRQPEIVPENVRALVADVFPEDQVFESSFQASYFATQQRPFDVMNTAFLQWWGDWSCKPALAMQQESAAILAHGGIPWPGYQMTHAFEVPPAVMGEFGKVMSFISDRQTLLHESQIVPDIAVMLGTKQPWISTDHPLQCDERSTRGVHRMFNELNLPHLFYSLTQLVDSLDQCQLVILPNEQLIDKSLADILSQWVLEGGILLATGLTDVNGHLNTLLGITRSGELADSHLYLDALDERLTPRSMEMAHLLEAPCSLVTDIADDVQILAKITKPYRRDDGHYLRLWSPPGDGTPYPALTIRKVGKGHAIYFAPDIFHAFTVKNQWNIKPILQNLLKMVGYTPRVILESTPWIQGVLHRRSSCHQTVLHLVNHHGSPRPAVKSNYCMQELMPVHHVKVNMQWDRKLPPASVRVEPQAREIPFSCREGRLCFVVEQVDLHVAVVIENNELA